MSECEQRYGNALERALNDAYQAARNYEDHPAIAACFRRIGDTCNTALDEPGVTVADRPVADLGELDPTASVQKKQNAMHIDLDAGDPPVKIVVTEEAVLTLARRCGGYWMPSDSLSVFGYKAAKTQRLLDDTRADLEAVVDLLHVDHKERTP